MRSQIALLCCALVVLNACYGYRAMPEGVAPDGRRIRATLTDAAAVELGGALGRGVQQVEGDVIRTDTQAVHLAIRTVRLRGGDEQYWRGENYALPRNAIFHIEERRIDRLRTALAIGGGLALLIGLGSVAQGGTGGDRPTPIPPPPQ